MGQASFCRFGEEGLEGEKESEVFTGSWTSALATAAGPVNRRRKDPRYPRSGSSHRDSKGLLQFSGSRSNQRLTNGE